MSRFRPETIPAVTEFSNPDGLPSAIASSPTSGSVRREGRRRAAVRGRPSSTAMSNLSVLALQLGRERFRRSPSTISIVAATAGHVVVRDHEAAPASKTTPLPWPCSVTTDTTLGCTRLDDARDLVWCRPRPRAGRDGHRSRRGRGQRAGVVVALAAVGEPARSAINAARRRTVRSLRGSVGGFDRHLASRACPARRNEHGHDGRAERRHRADPERRHERGLRRHATCPGSSAPSGSPRRPGRRSRRRSCA